MIGRLTFGVGLALLVAGCGGDSRALHAVGSSTVFPFTQAVAKAFVAADSSRKPPRIESIGTGPGIQKFCAGAGGEFPDMADASRRMRRVEYDKCQANKVGELLELQIGLDGLALAEANAGPKLSLTDKDIYLALAARPMGQPNTARTWRDVNPALPAVPIQVLAPPATSGTRDAFLELIMEPGCVKAMPAAEKLRGVGDPAAFDAACRQLRSDGAVTERAEGDDAAVLSTLGRTPGAVGLVGYSFLERNAQRLHGVPINGVAPAYDAIAGGRYPGARTLYLYVKKKHLDAQPSLKAFLELYAAMWNPGGDLAKLGLIAGSDRARARSAEAIRGGFALEPEALP
ncbi:phosphate ABC transporter substrate-binding protein, PhoT family [Sphingomonas guangdongensis]|uniref:Phosphate ABC transporter substrate-binding protein, PhoT family n=1 Tax=Sphingomonas guangdongensis TaxID=1141890 RepID=A0A285QZP7_9SPHN|nr:substrate-binding domain-containing protein [Sphingomonas guangdongensis]SOB87331.1 phosphate ABC transporter substrate-binding protein, PhoT family [Sphingomonas guangdongensis]